MLAMAMILGTVWILAGGGGCTHNVTKLDSGQAYTRTSDAQVASMDAEGNLRAAYHGVGPTQLFQDSKGNWTNIPGPVGVLSVPMPDGKVGYIISPNDTKIASIKFTPSPAAGSPAIEITGLEANISVPMGQQVEAIKAALPVLQAMTREEALATVEKWRIAGTMLPTVADVLKSIVSAVWPATAVTP